MDRTTLLRRGFLSSAALVPLMTGVGCATHGVPPFSQLVAQAPAGQSASFQAPDEGTVYVDGPGRNDAARHLIYTGIVHQSDTVTLDPPHGHLLVDGTPVNASLENSREGYTLWYAPVRRPLLP